jgi:hypothetical protein
MAIEHDVQLAPSRSSIAFFGSAVVRSIFLNIILRLSPGKTAGVMSILKRTMMRAFKARGFSAKQLFGLLFNGIGVILVIIGLVQLAGTAIFLGNARSASGTVTDYERVQNQIAFLEGTGYLYYPVVEFRAPGGEMIAFSSPSGRPEKAYEVGSTVRVLYNPSDAARARIDAFWSIWGRTVVFAGLGVLFFIIGLLAPHGFRRSGGGSGDQRCPDSGGSGSGNSGSPGGSAGHSASPEGPRGYSPS